MNKVEGWARLGVLAFCMVLYVVGAFAVSNFIDQHRYEAAAFQFMIANIFLLLGMKVV